MWAIASGNQSTLEHRGLLSDNSSPLIFNGPLFAYINYLIVLAFPFK